MPHTLKIIAVLKTILKAKGMSYKELGKKISLSEASVKRIFSKNTFTVSRLLEICEVLEVSFFQLAQMSETLETAGIGVLNEEQEQAFCANEELMAFYYALLKGVTRSRLTSEFGFSKEDINKYLLKLDRLNLLVLQTNGEFKIKTSRQVRWLATGSLMKKYGKALQEDFFNHAFHGENDFLRFIPARLSASSIQRFNKKLLSLLKNFEDLQMIDEEISADLSEDTALFIAFRKWEAPLLSKRRRRS